MNAHEGVLYVDTDVLAPCLIENETNALIKTTVQRFSSKAQLKTYTKKNGWYINWENEVSASEVYGIFTPNSEIAEGLISIKSDPDATAVYMAWGCAAPHNNKQLAKTPKYGGVGGHLFAIAAEKSFEYGMDGYLYGYAANKELLQHYTRDFGAVHVGILHQFHFIIEPIASKKLMEVYDYEWSSNQILGR